MGAFQPKKDSAAKFKREKNWGFVEEDGALMIYYALLHSRACYDDQAAIIEQQTGVTPQMKQVF